MGGASQRKTLSPRGRGQGEGGTALTGSPLDFTDLARRLRRDQTEFEARLWAQLRGRRLNGWKFKRQVPIGPYIADFVCADAWLIIELDGGHHNFAEIERKDRCRTLELEGGGDILVRFWNDEIRENLDGVCETILNLAQGAPSYVL